jgi:hypothetical protein
MNVHFLKQIDRYHAYLSRLLHLEMCYCEAVGLIPRRLRRMKNALNIG